VLNLLDSGVRLAAHYATLDGAVGAVVPISVRSKLTDLYHRSSLSTLEKSAAHYATLHRAVVPIAVRPRSKVDGVVPRIRLVIFRIVAAARLDSLIPSSVAHGLVSSIRRDRKSISQGFEANLSTFGVKMISQPEGGRARMMAWPPYFPSEKAGFRRWSSRISFSQKFERNVTRFAPHDAMRLIV
jgi:hypothetical protein